MSLSILYRCFVFVVACFSAVAYSPIGPLDGELVAFESALADDDTCIGRGAAELDANRCSLHALQTRERKVDGAAVNEHAVQKSRSRAKGKHKYVASGEVDYAADARDFLADYRKHGAPSCRLLSASLPEATRSWSVMLERITEESGLSQAEVDSTPWLPDRPIPNQAAPYDQAREAFAEELFDGAPGLVHGVAKDWPASMLWKDEDNLKTRFSEFRMPLMTFNYPKFLYKNNQSAEDLSEYLAHNDSIHNLFFFVDESEPANAGLSGLMDSLHADVQPRPAFAAHPDERHAIMAIEGVGASHGLHVHGPVWQTQVTGSKAWWLMPPNAFGEMVDENSELLEHTAAGLPQPLVDGHLYANACEFLQRKSPPAGAQVCVVEPGETMILPTFWWHATCALDHVTAAIGGFFEDNRGNYDESKNRHELFVQGVAEPKGALSS